MKTRLIQEQQGTARELVARLVESQGRVKLLGGTEVSRKEEFSNVFGIFGPRGAGKSTILSFLSGQGDPDQPDDPRHALRNFHVTPPLDCFMVPSGIDAGMAILLHAFPEIKESGESEESRLGRKLSEELQGIIATYIHMTREHRELRLDLASSPQKFGKDMVSDLGDRLAMARRLSDWLRRALLRMDQKALVVLLDDFDLVPEKEKIRNWLYAFFDELHQPQMFFVLAADYHRLEHLILDPDNGIDEQTGRAQLDKLFPWRHRLMLAPWSKKSRGDFLDTLIEDKIPQRLRRIASFHRLLPSRPRGIANLRETLDHSPTFSESLRSIQGLLALLAQSRSESLLTRHLEESDLSDWRDVLAFELDRDRILKISWSVEDWIEMVTVANHRARTAEAPGTRSFYGLDLLLRRISSVHESRVLLVDHLASTDPARHPELHEHPLRDADKKAIPDWIELLLELSFRPRSGDPLLSTHLLNRVRFLEGWAPTAQRSHRAHLQVLPGKDILNFFVDYEDLGLRSLFYWWAWDERDEATRIPLKFGWSPLIAALRQDRDPLNLEALSNLGLGIRTLHGDLPSTDPAEILGLIPDRVWAIVLLVDALDDCPWSAFSGPLGWSLPTYLLLTGVLIHGAYLHAMHQAGLVKVDDLKAEQKALLKALKARNGASYLLVGKPDENGKIIETQGYEANVFERLKSIVQASLPTGDNSLGRSAKSFQELAPYQALVRLADEGLLF